MDNAEALRDRYRGALLGLAVGDALGAAIEFSAPGTFEPVTGMRGGGPFGLKAGYWTDDTSMALCLAESLIECHGFDPVDQLTRYVGWYRTGHLSSTGEFFDIGIATQEALRRFERTGEPYCGSTSVTDPETDRSCDLLLRRCTSRLNPREPSKPAAIVAHHARVRDLCRCVSVLRRRDRRCSERRVEGGDPRANV